MAGRPASPRGGLQEMIYGHYKEALEALPLEHIPTLAPHLLDAGLCFGFADPVTNIIANTLCLVPDEDDEPDTRCVKKRKKMTLTEAREDVLSKIAAGDVPSPPEARTIAERSLRGLVVFLTVYFRHLPTEDAMRYLCLARADLLVAVRLIEVDRCLRQKYRFCISSHATKVAVRCAALAAGVPMVDTFVDAMLRIVSHLKLITQTVAAEKPLHLSLEDVRYLSRLVKKPLEMQPMDIADLCIRNQGTEASIEKVPVQLIASMRGVLLDRVHELYLKAVSRLPVKEFRISLHRGLLKAGYCYGPLSPIWNIIVNTIWYNTAFPASEEFKVDVISTMRHVESRSLNGLVAILCASFPALSEDEAMFYLLKSDLKVRKAIQMINREHVCLDESGYKAATYASSHPMPEEFLEFVVQYLPKLLPSVRSLMKASHLISSDDIIRLSSLLTTSAKPSAKPLDPPVELTNDALNMLSNHKKNFLTEQSTIRAKVEAALQKYEEVKGCSYELNMIYVVNGFVGKVTNIRSRAKQYSHVNFWATRKNRESPTLFFAQFSNDVDSKNDHPICYPVTGLSTHAARCCYCGFEGIRIVHPIQPFWDGGNEFEKISCGEHKITTERSISRGKLMDNDIGGLFKQHYIYLDPIWDCKLIPSINDIAWKATLTWEEQIRDAIDRSRSKVN